MPLNTICSAFDAACPAVGARTPRLAAARRINAPTRVLDSIDMEELLFLELARDDGSQPPPRGWSPLTASRHPHPQSGVYETGMHTVVQPSFAILAMSNCRRSLSHGIGCINVQ